MKNLQIKNILKDIRFWLIFFFLIRLIGITNAPLEIAHNWRQSFTNMIARNFLENGANILYPKIDMAGAKSGIIGSEFPFFNYLIYLVSSIFDFSHWYGRLISLSVSTAGVYYFHRLVKKLMDPQTAFNATIVLSVSIWFAYSRKIMPDTFSVSLVIIGLYYAYNFLKYGSRTSLIPFFVFCTLGMLCKIPALTLFSALSITIFIKEIDLRRKVALYSVGTLSFLVVCSWYFYWVPHLLETYGYQLYFPKSIAEGVQEIIPLIPELLEKFYFSSLHSYLAFICFLFGVFLLLKNKNNLLMGGIGIVTVVFVLFIIKTGAVFPLHSYYIIPFTPIMALLAGYSITRIPLKFQYLLLGLISIEGIANQQHDFFVKETQLYKLKLEEKVNKYTHKEDLIVINGGQSAQDIYFANRKGWTVDNEFFKSNGHLDSLRNLGARFLIIDKTDFNGKIPKYPLKFSDDHYSIFKLEKGASKK